MQATVSIFGIYNYDNTIFDEFVEPMIQLSDYDNLIDNPPPFDKQRFIQNLVFQLANLEVVYPDAKVLKRMIGLWSSLNARNWGLLYTSMFYKYNPIWNKDGVTERELKDKGSVDGKTDIKENNYRDKLESVLENLKDTLTANDKVTNTENTANSKNSSVNNSTTEEKRTESTTSNNEGVVTTGTKNIDGGSGEEESHGEKSSVVTLNNTNTTETEDATKTDTGTVTDTKVYQEKEVGTREITVNHGETIQTEPGHIVNETYGNSGGTNNAEISTKAMWPFNSNNESPVEKITTIPADKVTEYVSKGRGDYETHGGTTYTKENWVGDGHQKFIDDTTTKTLNTGESTHAGKSVDVSENGHLDTLTSGDKATTENHYESEKTYNENSTTGTVEVDETVKNVNENLEIGLENQSGKSDSTTDGERAENRNSDRNLTRSENERGSADSARTDKTESEKETTEKIVERGNIGVTMTQQLIEKEREIAIFNIYDFITQSFKENFCVMVY